MFRVCKDIHSFVIRPGRGSNASLVLHSSTSNSAQLSTVICLQLFFPLNRPAVTVAIEWIVSVSRERLSYDVHLFSLYKYFLLIKQSSPLKVKRVHVCNQPTPPKTCESLDVININSKARSQLTDASSTHIRSFHLSFKFEKKDF